MQLAQFVRLSGLLLVVGVAGLMLGCGEGSTAPSVTKDEASAAKQEQRAARKETKEARKQALTKGGGAQKGRRD
jgi:hypothetical protein